jgi:hypothetical protein
LPGCSHSRYKSLNPACILDAGGALDATADIHRRRTQSPDSIAYIVLVQPTRQHDRQWQMGGRKLPVERCARAPGDAGLPAVEQNTARAVVIPTLLRDID